MSNALMIGNAAMAGFSAYQQFAKPTMKAPGGGIKSDYTATPGSMGQYSSQGITGLDMSGSFSNNFSGNQLGLLNVNVKDSFKVGF